MNILHLLSRSDSYDAIAGALDLISHLDNKGCNCVVTSSLNPAVLESNRAQIQHYDLPKFEANIKHFFVAYKKLKEIIEVNKIDVVHSYCTVGSWLAFLACRHTDRPMINTCYDFYPKNLWNHALILNKKVVVHNEALGEHLISNYNLPRERLRFIKQSLDLSNYNFQDVDQRSKTDFNIGMIAPSQPSKEYEYFLKAMVKVTRIIPPIKIWLISYRSKFRQNIKEDLEVWIRRLGLTNYVKFFDTSDLNLSFLSKLNILMFSAFQENAAARPILEAQAYGVPVITTRVGGVADIIIDNKTGILVPPQDNSLLANTIIKTLKDFSLSRDIAINARKRIEKEFNLKNNISDFIDTYKEVKNNVKILAINVGSIQEIISSIPALQLIKDHIPHNQITSLINHSSRSLLRRCPYVDEFIVYDRQSKHKGLAGFMHILSLLIRGRFDLVFDFENNFKTHLLSYLCLANKRFGYANNFVHKFLINNGVKKPGKSTGLTENKLQLLSPLKIESKDHKLELWPAPEDIEFAENFLKDSWIGKEKIVGMDISSRRRFFKNTRTIDYLAYLCDRLANQQIRVMLFDTKDDSNIKNQLFKRIKSKPILAMGNMSTIQVACLIKKCDLYISLNQESSYLALAMKIPSIILASKINNSDFIKHKNIQVLPAKYFSSNIQAKNKKRRFRDSTHKDNVIEVIDKLIQGK